MSVAAFAIDANIIVLKNHNKPSLIPKQVAHFNNQLSNIVYLNKYRQKESCEIERKYDFIANTLFMSLKEIKEYIAQTSC